MSPTVAIPGSEPTRAELVALQAYISGGSVQAAAHRLGLAESTIKAHLANVRSRLGAKTTAEAALRLADCLVG